MAWWMVLDMKPILGMHLHQRLWGDVWLVSHPKLTAASWVRHVVVDSSYDKLYPH